MWALFICTAVVGVAMYVTFGRTEGLWVAGGVLGILVYLLIGVAMTIRSDEAALGPLVETAAQDLSGHPYWVIIDGHTGAILMLTELGCQALGHSHDVLHGQRLSDLAEEAPAAAKVAFTEMLRFGLTADGWRGHLTLKDEAGTLRVLDTQTLPLSRAEARRARLIAIGPRLPEDPLA